MPDREAPGQLRMAFVAKERDELHELAAEMTRYHRQRGSGRDTIRTSQRVFRILDDLGVHTYAELTDPTLDSRFVAFTASKGWAASTQDLFRGHFHAILNHAHEWDRLPCQPAIPSRVKPGGPQWREEHPPSPRTLPAHPDEVRRVLEYFQGRKDTWRGFRSYAYLTTIAWTRLPLRRAIRLRKKNVLLKEGDPLAKGDVDMWPAPVFRFRPRGGKEQRLPIPANLVPILDEWIDKNRSPWWVFPGPKDQAWSLQASHNSATPARELRAACLALGLEPFTCEQLRGSLVAPRSEATGMAPPLHISPPAPAPHSDHQDLDQAAPTDPLDEIAYADKLLAHGFTLEAAFVRHFQGRTSSTYQEIVDAICPGAYRDWPVVKKWASRVNAALRKVDPSCPFRFRTTIYGHRVMKRPTPSKPA